MATGSYGINRPADVSPQDVEIFYSFATNRDATPSDLKRINPIGILNPVNHPDQLNGNTVVFGGLYNLVLPAGIFSNKGFYTVIIKPKEYRIKIQDCGVLSAFPDIKGIVLDSTTIPVTLSAPNGLVGYRIEYFDSNNNKISNLFRIVTSSNKAEPVNQNLQNTTQKAIRYRFNETSTLIFCTLTPSSAPTVQPNQRPFIGQPGQDIILTNTFFNPVVLEIEMAEHDFDTLSYGIFGNQTKSIVDGKYTIYDKDNNIFKQYNLYEIQDQFTGEPLYEVRQEVSTIDFSKNFNIITNNTPNA